MSSNAKGDIKGYLLVGLPVLGGLLAAFMNWVPSPTGSLITTVAVIAATAILVGMDAKSRGFGGVDENGKRQTGPLGWGLGTLLLWIIVYPWYMVKRRQMMSWGLVAAAIFLLVPLGIAIAYPNGRPPTTAMLSLRVGSLIRENFMQDPKKQMLLVEKVTLVHKGGNSYEGIIKIDAVETGEKLTLPLTVIYDGESIRWQISAN